MKSDPPAPTSFDNRFRDWKLLSEGAEGVLYRVTDRWTGRVCALKVAKSSDQARDGLIQEFRLLSHLRHPCLIESLGLVRDGELLGHLLEYVPVVPSHEIFERGGEDAVRAAFVQALRGVHYLHRQGWLHTDISPGNILVWQEGDSWRAKVADLGLVYRAEEAEGLNPRGTVETMSPEVARGEGARPESDWFGLGATLVSWIDGSLWSESMSSRDILREVAAVKEPLQARKRVDSELAKWISEVTEPEPSRRHIPAWDQLRRNADAWGPDVLVGGLHGLDDTTSALESWLQEVPVGQVGAIVLQGRVGTGRRTLGRLMARTLVASGWVGLTEMSLGAVSDWLGEDEPDPVRLARELSRRYKGVDLVVSWLSDVGELESRLYEALIASRAQSEGDQHRTVVIKVEGRGERASWLNRQPWVREESWSGVSSDALEQIAADLYAEETGVVDDSSGSPLSLEMGKRAFLSGREAVSGEAVASVESDTLLALSKMRDESQLALYVLSASGEPWSFEQLRNLLQIGEKSWGEIVSELRSSLLVESVYSRGEEGLTVPDWLVRDVLTNRFSEGVPRESAQSILDRLQTRGRSSEISLLIACLSTGAFRNDLVLGVLRDGLQEGQYESVVNLYKAAEDFDGFDVAAGAETALRAAERLGKFDVQVELLRTLVEKDQGNKTNWSVMLSKALFAAGTGDEAFQIAKSTIETGEADPEKILNAASIAWQVGSFDDSEELFARLESYSNLDSTLLMRARTDLARSLASRARIDDARVLFEKIDPELGSNDPQYLRLKTGLIQGSGSQVEARKTIDRAADIAEREFLWKDYVEVNLRRCSLEQSLGNFQAAATIATEAESLSLALGSTRLSMYASFYRGQALTQLGYFEEAILRTKEMMEFGLRNSETTSTNLGSSFLLEVGYQWGLEGIVREGMEAIGSSDVPYLHARLLALEANGLFFSGDYEAASLAYLKCGEAYAEAGVRDNALEFSLSRIRSQIAAGIDVQHERDLNELSDLAESSSYRRLDSQIDLLRTMNREPIAALELKNALEQLVAKGQINDVYFVMPILLRRAGTLGAEGFAIKTLIHRILLQIVDGIRSVSLRDEFGKSRHFNSVLDALGQ
ncbi:MAG: protein kinase [Candidatus Eisenbacteria bacterium]|uniref:Protein kinase n=1 Tax=Eiseniibacteriota bacterium TaxID=2212470 RepID=A0A7Y2EDM4_UNCEI|nr:protein kinase [Candidatus Eisenbacteria bacterium]